MCSAAHSGVADIYGLLGRDTTPDNLQIVLLFTVDRSLQSFTPAGAGHVTRGSRARARANRDLCQLSIMLISSWQLQNSTPIPIQNLDFYSFLDTMQNASNKAKL